jgi:hypothetical protein
MVHHLIVRPRALLEGNDCPAAQSKSFRSLRSTSTRAGALMQHPTKGPSPQTCRAKDNRFGPAPYYWLLASGFNVGHWSGPLKPRVGVWPRRKPFSRAKNPPIALICELKEQGRIGAIVAGEGKFAISDRAKTAHVKNPTQQHKNSNRGSGLVPVRRLPWHKDKIDEGPKAAMKGRRALIGPALSFSRNPCYPRVDECGAEAARAS